MLFTGRAVGNRAAADRHDLVSAWVDAVCFAWAVGVSVLFTGLGVGNRAASDRHDVVSAWSSAALVFNPKAAIESANQYMVVHVL